MKSRLDEYLVANNPELTYKQSQGLIMSGKVLVDNYPETKVGLIIDSTKQEVRIKQDLKKYVSRSGEKLAYALETFQLDVTSWLVLDVGSSTGGFVDCLLKKGAEKVYALDVGTNQLAYTLRIDRRVVVLEQTNFRDYIADFSNKFSLITMDVSFISITLLLENVKAYLQENGFFICLVKPQYEVSKEIADLYQGVITDKVYHEEAIEKVIAKAQEYNLQFEKIVDSPVKGQKGNQEYLLLFSNNNK